jgi:hypothetical protein
MVVLWFQVLGNPQVQPYSRLFSSSWWWRWWFKVEIQVVVVELVVLENLQHLLQVVIQQVLCLPQCFTSFSNNLSNYSWVVVELEQPVPTWCPGVKDQIQFFQQLHQLVVVVVELESTQSNWWFRWWWWRS